MIPITAALVELALVSSFSLPPECKVPTYAIHKPRGVLSRTGFDTIADADADAVADDTKDAGALHIGRRTLTDLMVAAGVEPLSKHIGRLDLETGGLILVTADALLLEAALSMPGATSLWLQSESGTDCSENSSTETAAPTPTATSFKPLTKTYELLLAGRYCHDAAAIEELRAPLVHNRGGQTYHSDSATVRFLRCFQNEALATEYSLLDCHDEDGKIEARRHSIRAKREKPIRSRKTGELLRPYIPSDGWLTEVSITIHQGRHHQIRRLCARAGLKLLHLRRVAFGPIELGSMRPGDVRVLGEEEKLELYRACVPCLEGAHQLRTRAMAAARNARVDRTTQPTERTESGGEY